MAEATKRCAVVTGANKGIGLEVCRQLASNDILVVLTARNENNGLEAIKKLKDSGISDRLLVFHQLDVVDPNSIVSLADFVKSHFGKLDILVNNAGISGAAMHVDSIRRAIELHGGLVNQMFFENLPNKRFNLGEFASQNVELTEECLKTNYYGAKAMVEAFAPLLQLSDSPRILNVSSSTGLLKNITNEWARGVLSDVEGLTEERIDEVVNEFMKDFKDGLLETKGWPIHLAAYIVAKAAMNAYTRFAAKKYPSFVVNSVSPGFCRTDITANLGPLTAAEGAENVVRLALLPKHDSPSGCFFHEKQMVDF